jgi:hypothetical protein
LNNEFDRRTLLRKAVSLSAGATAILALSIMSITS